MQCLPRLVLIILVSAVLARPLYAQPFSSKYDIHFRIATKRYLPIPYEIWGHNILKAQAWQESRFNPKAISPVGARGIMQFMPGTWKEVSQQMGFGMVSASNVKLSIYAGAYYMSRMRRTWKAKRSERDRYDLALASYNAGAGNLIKSQRKCGGVNDYPGIIKCLPMVTGKYSEETINYVRLIRKYYEQMRFR